LSKSKIYGLILSAGLSGRMKMFKPLANYKGKTFLYNIIIKLYKICDEIIIVTGFNSDELRIETIKSLQSENQPNVIPKLNFTFNESFQKGMFTSLQKGISEASNCDWILYHFVDQPGLPENFYLDFIKQADSNYNWIQPVNKDQKGHPILLGKELFDLIADSSPGSNLREISKSSKVKKKYWECSYTEIFQDIDTEEDYLKV
jgi:molybdenum cofactor cytidylyltransferase